MTMKISGWVILHNKIIRREIQGSEKLVIEKIIKKDINIIKNYDIKNAIH